MKALSLFSILMLTASVSFAETAICNLYLDNPYSSENNDYVITSQKRVENEHADLVKQHNLQVSKNGKGHYIYPMVPDALADDKIMGAHYFSEAEIMKAKISFESGRILRENKPLTTFTPSLEKPNEWDFTMTANEDIYMYPSVQGLIQHSSATHGKPIASAGTIKVSNGIVYLITTRTGHYLDPTGRFIQQFIKVLRKNGVLFADKYKLDSQVGDL